MPETAGAVGLFVTVFLLGLRHGIDWDHLAAIFDIAGTTTSVEIESHLVGAVSTTVEHDGHHHIYPTSDAIPPSGQAVSSHTRLRAMFLALMYALGHGAMVILLGIAAIFFNTLLPDWIDPIMGRIVGATLLLLGGWVVYSLVQFARGKEETFVLRSRWMLVFAFVRNGIERLRAHRHQEEVRPVHVEQYGVKTAFGIGLVHGIGAETGTQVLLIAAIGSTENQGLGFGMLLFFVFGLIISNSLVALAATSGFVTSSRARPIYIGIGVLTAVFSIVVGTAFVLGLDASLPDLSGLTSFLGGPELE